MTTLGSAGLKVAIESVEFSGRRVLEALSFECHAGEHTVVLGPNGAGKTTLLRAILGLVPFKGKVWVGDQELSSLSPDQRARFLSYVPQKSQLNAAICVEDVVMQGRFAHRAAFGGATSTDQRVVQRALQDADLTQLAQKQFNRLSGGEQRRVLLARALATEAPIICLDEPTAFLDLSHALQLFRLLAELKQQGRTIVSVLHDLHDARRFGDRALVLQAGQLRYAGPAAVPRDIVQTTYGVHMLEASAPSFELLEDK